MPLHMVINELWSAAVILMFKLVLLIYHDIDGAVWQNCGIAKKPRFLPVQIIRCGLNPDVREALPLFHALTGCDTTSQFCGYGKKSSWKVLLSDPQLLATPMRSDSMSRDMNIKLIELFIIKIYHFFSSETSIQKLRVSMFYRVDNLSKLPPSYDALYFHILRAILQTITWKNACIPKAQLLAAKDFGSSDGCLRPKATSLDPMPKECVELITCSCKSDCTSKRCSCKKNYLPCTSSCLCQSDKCQNRVVYNITYDSDDEND